MDRDALQSLVALEKERNDLQDKVRHNKFHTFSLIRRNLETFNEAGVINITINRRNLHRMSSTATEHAKKAMR